MTAPPPRFSVVVPVRNEARTLPETVPSLLAAAGEDGAEFIFVCNGCTDDSAALLRRLAPAARVIERAAPGKARALAEGDAAATVFPRFFADADCRLPAGAFAHLARPLEQGEADLVAPRTRFDTRRASASAAAVARTWLGLPHAGQSAFHLVLGLSEAGRRAVGPLPDVLGDDIYIASRISAGRRRIVSDVEVTTEPPRTFARWVAARARWRRGERELARLGLAAPRADGQRRALLARLVSPRTAPAALVFLAARLAGGFLSLFPARSEGWSPDRR